MAACDFIVAADNLKVCFPEVRRGLIPALISIVLSSRLRDSDLRELLLLAEPIDAQRALDIGLMNRVVPADRIIAEARSLAESVLLGAPEAVRHTKRSLQASDQFDIARLFQHALETHKEARRSDEAREGLAAFQEHRLPQW